MFVSEESKLALSSAFDEALDLSGFEGPLIDSFFTDPAKKRCPAPGLHPQGGLLGVDFCSLTGPVIGVSFAEFVGNYEEFLGTWITGNPQAWDNFPRLLSWSLDTTYDQAKFYFGRLGHTPVKDRMRQKRMIVMALAQTAFSQFGGTVIEESRVTFEVAVESCRFGIRNGKPISNWHGVPAGKNTFLCRGRLSQLWKPHAGMQEPLTIDDKAYEVLAEIAKDLPEAKIIQDLATAVTVFREYIPGGLRELLSTKVFGSSGWKSSSEEALHAV